MDMKRIMLTLLLIGGITTKASAAVVGDTLVIQDAKKVKIETGDTQQRIVISGTKEDPHFNYIQRIDIPDSSAVRRTVKSVKNMNKVPVLQKNSKAQKGFSLDLYALVGLNLMSGTPGGYNFKAWPSLGVGLGVEGKWRPYGKKNIWTLGFGMEWRTYYSDDKCFWVKEKVDNGEVMHMEDYGDKQSDTETRLNVYSLQVPLLYTHYFDDKCKWGLSLGAVVNFNLSASANRKFTFEDEEYEVKTRSIMQRPVTVDAMVVLHNPAIDIYCKYSPMKFFKDDKGPDIHQLSFGFFF